MDRAKTDALRHLAQLPAQQGSDDQTAAWDEPIPIERAKDDAPRFPSGILTGSLERFVNELSIETQTPEEMGAILTLGAISAAASGRFAVRPTRAYVEPINLFVAAVAEPGERKSAVVRAVTRPLMEHERRANEQTAAGRAKAESRFRVAEKRLASVEGQLVKAKAEDVASLEADADRAREYLEMVRPVPPMRLVVDDATPETVSSMLAEQNGRLAIVSAEGGGLFDMMAGRYGNTPNLDVYLKGHAGDAIHVDRKKRPSEYVQSPSLTIVIAVQPTALRVLSRNPEMSGRGLPARFLFAVPESCVGGRDVEPPALSAEARNAYAELVEWALRIAPATDDEGRAQPHVLTLSREAHDLYIAFARRTEVRMRETGDLHRLAEWSSKFVGAVVRIAGVLHLAGNSGAMAVWEIQITAETLGRAIRLGEEFLVPHARRAFGIMSDTPSIDTARKILRWLERDRPAMFAVREAYRHIQVKGERKTVMDPALDVLIAHGWIQEIAPDGILGANGRPAKSERYTVHPSLRVVRVSVSAALPIEGIRPSISSIGDFADDAPRDPPTDTLTRSNAKGLNGTDTADTLTQTESRGAA